MALILSPVLVFVGTTNVMSADAATCDNSSTPSVTANGFASGYPPANTLDNSLSTRWANNGIGSWIRYDFGVQKTVCYVDIAWYNGNLGQYNFVIGVSNDGVSYTTVTSRSSTGTTAAAERYDFTDINARYVRITVNGNTQTTWASITEVDINGSSTAGGTGTGTFDVAIYPIQSGTDVRNTIQKHSTIVTQAWNFRLDALDKFTGDQHILMDESLDKIRSSINTEIQRSGVSVQYIAYDLEGSNGNLSSPPAEVENAAQSINTAMDLIHNGGYKSVAGPTRTILWKAYQGVQWNKVDVVAFQMQKVIGLSQFDDIMNNMLPFIKAQNPNIQVVVQVGPRLFSNTDIVNQINEHKDKIDVVMIMWDLDDVRVLDDLITKLEQIR